MPLATERAGGLAWEYLFPFDGQAAAVGLLARPGHRACRRWRARPRGCSARPTSSRSRCAGSAIFQTAPPAGVRVRVRRRRALPAVLRAAEASRCSTASSSRSSASTTSPQLTGDATARALFDAGDLAGRAGGRRRSTPAPGRCTRAGRSSASPTSATTSCCATSSAQLCKRTAAEQYCSAEPALHEYLTTPPVVEVAAAHAASPRSRASCASSSRRSRAFSVADHAAGRSVVATINPGVLCRGTKTLAWTAPKKIRRLRR